MRSSVVLLLASSGVKSSWRRSAHELVLRCGTVVVVSPPSLLPPSPSSPLFSLPLLSSEKYSPPLLLDSLVRSMSMFLFLLEVVMLLKNISGFDNVG